MGDLGIVIGSDGYVLGTLLVIQISDLRGVWGNYTRSEPYKWRNLALGICESLKEYLGKVFSAVYEDNDDKMPFGTIKTSSTNNSTPIHSAPYSSDENEFSDVTCLVVRYRTTAESVKDLLPEELEIEDQPLVGACLFRYGMSPIGPYTEFVHQIEVKYKGELYDYNITLLLDNQAAIFSGRERYGIPKTMGNVVFNPSEPSPRSGGFITGIVERPTGVTLGVIGFKPERLVPYGPIQPKKKEGLNIRLIPSPVDGEKPSLREFVVTRFDINEGEVWTGQASVKFTGLSDFDPLHKLPVVRYESATLIRRGIAVLRPSSRLITI